MVLFYLRRESFWRTEFCGTGHVSRESLYGGAGWCRSRGIRTIRWWARSRSRRRYPRLRQRRLTGVSACRTAGLGFRPSSLPPTPSLTPQVPVDGERSARPGDRPPAPLQPTRVQRAAFPSPRPRPKDSVVSVLDLRLVNRPRSPLRWAVKPAGFPPAQQPAGFPPTQPAAFPPAQPAAQQFGAWPTQPAQPAAGGNPFLVSTKLVVPIQVKSYIITDIFFLYLRINTTPLNYHEEGKLHCNVCYESFVHAMPSLH